MFVTRPTAVAGTQPADTDPVSPWGKTNPSERFSSFRQICSTQSAPNPPHKHPAYLRTAPGPAPPAGPWPLSAEPTDQLRGRSSLAALRGQRGGSNKLKRQQVTIQREATKGWENRQSRSGSGGVYSIAATPRHRHDCGDGSKSGKSRPPVTWPWMMLGRCGGRKRTRGSPCC